jgi:phosphomannomutase / phosphoglucomutase
MLSFGKKQTALESAMSTKASQLNLERIGMSVGFAVMLLVAGLCIFQAVMVWLEDRALASLVVDRDEAVGRISALVSAEQKGLAAALGDEAIRGALVSGDPLAGKKAETLLKARIPEVDFAQFFAPDLPELVDADLSVFGYAKADVLAEAREKNGRARAQSHHCVNVDGECLALAHAVRNGDQVIAYAYVLLPLDEILTSLGNSAFGGTVDLKQGSENGADWTLRRIGTLVTSELTDKQDSKPIPESHFHITVQRNDLFKPGMIFGPLNSRSIGGLLAMALLCIGGGVAFAFKRVFPNGLRRKAAPEVDEPMVAVAMAEPKTKPARIRVTSDAGADASMVVQEMDSQQVAAPRTAAALPSAAVAGAIDRSIFRAYDIRGVVGKTLTGPVAMLIGQAIGSLARARGLSQICVARDGRLSGPQLSEAMIAGLRASGCDVIDIGMVPTPVLYFATYHLNTGSGVMVTGSHNPPEYNGFKIVVGGQTLAEETIQELFARIVEGNLSHGMGGLQSVNVKDDYLERIVSDVQTSRRLKVVVDCGNGVAGAIAPQVLEGIGCEVEPLYCEVDGNFPNHHPDPSDPHNLAALIMAVKQLDADLGLAFDGDGDRLGVVTRQGEIIYPDRVLMLFAQDVLTRNPGAAVIYDVKCTGQLAEVILRAGGSPIMWKTGHSLIKAKMREEDAALAGEMSGHFFFAERWFGFDDGIYAAARLLEILALRDETAQEIFDELPKGVSTPELKVEMKEGEHYAFMEKFRERAKFPGARVTTIDGVRADYKDGWGLVRCSNTTPCLVLRFDASSKAAIDRIQESFRSQLLAVDSGMKLPF